MNLVVAGILASSLCIAIAQPDRNRTGRRSGPAEPPPPSERSFRERPAPTPSGLGLERLFGILTQDQRQSLRDVLIDLRDQNRETERKLRDLRSELLDLALAKPFREMDFRRKTEEAAKLEAERMVQMAKAFSQVQPPLSPEQIERIKRGSRSSGDRSRGGDRSRQEHDKNDLPPGGR